MKQKSRMNHKVVNQTERDNFRDILTDMFRFYGAPELLTHNPRSTIATMLLMAAKLYDKQVLKDDSLLRAKLVARLVCETGELAPALGHVLLAIEMNDKQFFIDFARCLSGDIKDPTVFDKRERDIAEIVAFTPNMSAKQAVRELERRGHRGITEENFRMWKMRLLKARPLFNKLITWCRNNFSPVAVTEVSD